MRHAYRPGGPVAGFVRSNMASVSIESVKKRFGEVEVLHGVDISIADGSFTVLVGPSGCGKSTLLRMIAGLEGISGGTIRIGDKVVNQMPPKERDIAMVFQNYALYPHMTVRDNMAFALMLAKQSNEVIDQKVGRAAEILGLKDLLQRFPRQLSGGQRQRVAMGRAIVRDPQVFLFDEPLSNLDAKLRSELRVEIKRLHQRLGNTMIYVTHDQIEAMTLADRIAVMRGGVVQQLDTPQAIYGRPVNRFVAGFLGSPAMNFLKGRIEHDGGAPWFMAEGVAIPLATYAFETKPKDGPAVFGIRPEHIGINMGDGWPFSADTDVDVVEPMGSDTLVWARIGGQNLSVRITAERAPRPGDRISVSFDPMRASLFGEDENRL